MGKFIQKIAGFVLLALLPLSYLSAQTNVNGVIAANTTWSLANSPFIVKGNILVNPGFTLTIEPGVSIKVDGNYYIKIEGVLDAVGSANSKITFETNLPNSTDTSKNSWNGIQIRPTGGSIISNDLNYTSGTRIKYVVIKNASKGIYVYSTGTYIANTEFTNNNIGIEFRSSNNVLIDNCTFSNNIYGTYTEYESSVSDGTSAIQNTYIQNSIFNNNATFISSLNISGFTLLNDTTINGILNVSSNSIFNSATFTSSLNVSPVLYFNMHSSGRS
jgi:hypothetical protein